MTTLNAGRIFQLAPNENGTTLIADPRGTLPLREPLSRRRIWSWWPYDLRDHWLVWPRTSHQGRRDWWPVEPRLATCIQVRGQQQPD
jgi:hypothetical protein